VSILRTEQLEKTFATGGGDAAVAAVRGVNLEVAAGSFVVVTGASGCGKSTLLHMLGGITRPTAGRVLLEGIDLSTLGDDDLAAVRRRRIGFVFQRYNLLPELSLLENVALPLMLDGVAAARCDAAARESLDAVGMAHRALHRPDALSGGEQQRGAIARALVTAPAVLRTVSA
jgi:putative ABC transport system ATP-binding protein